MIVAEGDFKINSINDNLAYHWNGEYSEKGLISIPEYVEKNDYRLRKKYLDYIDKIEQKFSEGEKVKHPLKYKKHSLWWMSTLIEKNMIKSPAISDSIKMFALEEIIESVKPKKLEIFVSDIKIINSLKYLTTKLNIKIIINKNHSNYSPSYYFKKIIPFFLRGIIFYFKNIILHFSYKKQKPRLHKENQQIFIFSHFTNFNLPKDLNSSIKSNYWGVLPSFLNSHGIKMNFLNHFHKSKKSKSLKEGSKIINMINKNSLNHGEIHYLLPSLISVKTLIRIFLYFIGAQFKGEKIYSNSSFFTPDNSNVSLFYFCESDWKNSFFGPVLIENLFFIESIEHYFKNLPSQKLGLYLQENNGWERAFIYAWKKYQKAPLIGIAHTIIRYWDLRYFQNSSIFSDLPSSDYTAVNGPVSKNILLEAGFNKTKILEVEALRYLKSSDSQVKKLRKNNRQKKIIVFGDIDIQSTKAMLESLNFCINYIGKNRSNVNFQYAFKPHPVNEIVLDNFGLNTLEIISKEIKDVIKNYDIAISVDTTTAGVEAYLAGLDIIVFKYSKRPNFSPLRNIKDIHFVSNGEQLLESINKLSLNNRKTNNEIFFWDDNQLPRWHKIFSNYFKKN